MAVNKARSKAKRERLHKEHHDRAIEPPPTSDGSSTDLTARELFINRELSLLAFQRRVLEEAADPDNPLLERVKFLSIFGSNLDEFFMVRVAGLMQKVEGNSQDIGVDGRTPSAQLEAIRQEVTQLLGEAY